MSDSVKITFCASRSGKRIDDLKPGQNYRVQLSESLEMKIPQSMLSRPSSFFFIRRNKKMDGALALKLKQQYVDENGWLKTQRIAKIVGICADDDQLCPREGRVFMASLNIDGKQKPTYGERSEEVIFSYSGRKEVEVTTPSVTTKKSWLSALVDCLFGCAKETPF